MLIWINGFAAALPMVNNGTTTHYADVTDPIRISFASDGTLYTGRDDSGSGGEFGAAVKIHRIAVGGGTATEFGSVAISDPDSVIVDKAGLVSGIAGSVIVGGVHTGGSTGKIVRIAPDETVTTLFGPSADIHNPSDFLFDSGGRLLFTEHTDGKVMVTTGSMPTKLFDLPGALSIVEDAAGRLVISSSLDEKVRTYDTNGTLLDGDFGQAKAGSPLVSGTGGMWGTDVYAVNNGGNLIALDPAGGPAISVGTGFADVANLAFGPDGALYACEFVHDRVWRIELNAPKLGIRKNGTSVVLSWLRPAAGMQLQETVNLTGTSTWGDIPPPYDTTDSLIESTRGIVPPTRFFRLHAP